MTSLKPGTRISLSGSIGTVRYTGLVEGTTGTWIGVEWDEPSRGKHDGVGKDGKRYFRCSSPTAGSFIRHTKAISLGTSFLHALKGKYVEARRGSSEPERVILGSSNGSIQVEAPGLDKIRGQFANLQGLREVSLGSEGVSSGEPGGEIRRTCPGVRGLDLSASLIPSWDIVASITFELPDLKRLALNRNRLQPFTDIDNARSSFLSVTHLQLSATMMSWLELENIIVLMSSLRDVEFGYNCMTELPIDRSGSTSFPSVESLNLDGNLVQSWRNISSSLSTAYPSLKRLVLTNNLIERIGEMGESETPLAQLRTLSFTENRIATWADIDRVARWCPNLESLTITSNPIAQGDSGHARPFTIARIATLTTLDGAAIGTKERTDCELFYLSFILRNGPASEEDRTREHPRWPELCLKHGRPEGQSLQERSRPEKLSNHLIDLQVCKCSSTPPPFPTHDGTSKSMRVLLTMSLRTLRSKMFKTFKAPGQKINEVSVEIWLKMRDGIRTGVLLSMDQDEQDLDWLGLETGSELWVYIDG